ncbi:MAG: LemA family protein [Prevotella sp.]|uniref:LemA family protein n=1 Tax=Prevotella sp. Rep29 TaxID=2691580 RepID=UPI001C6ED32B|nr:LemA family protein [Prevotella sp. Rep29]MBQ3624939.1 LemA family protein [Prevotella sp.]MBR1655167.1 LemA family protein [Prevotella sp.]MBR3389171.1 LemA family protein [Prevotella sp.]MBR7093952.1 LemA family protein [Prevotella sp.]QYR11604.1 LemA family protein [Prevotella sp. Rep29]
MKKKSFIGLAVVAVIVLMAISAYNGMVSSQEKATQTWADLQATYQRRADLIPNLVNTVKAYAKHEKETFEAVVNARAKATQMNIDISNATPEQIKQFQEAQGELSSALNKLMAITENYPELKANENFMALQDQLEGSENRINEARQKYNKAVTDYNTSIRSFPKSLFAGVFGFKTMDKFEAEAAAQKAPTVNFD